MKFVLSFLMLPCALWAKGATTSAPAKDEVTRMVEDEYSKETANVRTEWEKVSKRLAELDARKESAQQESKTRGQWEANGAELLQKFQTVINSRYHGTNGEFEGGLELSSHDMGNINKVFSRYLAATPLKGKISAGEAIRFLDWGIKRLSTLSKYHLEPTNANNSELEILGYQRKVAMNDRLRLVETGRLVGIDFESKHPTRQISQVNEPNPLFVASPPTKPGYLLPPVDEESEAAEVEEEPVALPERKTASKKKKSSLIPDF